MSYDLFIEREVYDARHSLPGKLRQRVRRSIETLKDIPRPPESDDLDSAGLSLPPGVEIRRIRLERWRIIYAVCDDERWVWVLGICRRPPYDYDDLAELISRLPGAE